MPTQMMFILLQQNLPSLSITISNEYLIFDRFLEPAAEFPETEYKDVDFFAELIHRSPNLTAICLNLDDSMISDAQTTKYLAALRSLQKLTMPYFRYDSDTISELAKLPNLHTIEFHPEFPPRFALEQESFRPELREGAFPKLRNLSLNAKFKDVSRFFRQRFAPKTLRHLFITAEQFQTSERLALCLSSVVDSCKLLNSLAIDMATGASHRREIRISYQDLAILKALPNLKNFRYTHRHSVSLTDEELGDLVSSWVSLEALSLTAKAPHLTSPISLTLACLIPLAQYCPNLRTLGLYVDATVPVNLPTTFKPFRNLEELDMGSSPIKEAHTVATFLGTLCQCPTGLSLWTHFNLFPSRPEFETLNEYEKLWEQTTTLIHASQN